MHALEMHLLLADVDAAGTELEPENSSCSSLGRMVRITAGTLGREDMRKWVKWRVRQKR